MTVVQWLELNVDQLDRRGLGVGPMAPFALAANVSASPWRAVVSHGGGRSFFFRKLWWKPNINGFIVGVFLDYNQQ